MKATSILGIAFLTICCNMAFGADVDTPVMRARPIQVLSCGAAPEGLAFDIRPMGFRSGFEIYYLVEGQGIAGFESLSIDSIKTAQGSDISKSASGEPNYEAGPFPRRSADGKYCVFSLEVNHDEFGKVDQLAVKGNVTILLGTKKEAKKIELKTSDNQEKKVGPFSVRVKPAGAPSPFKFGPADSLDVEITGPLSSLSQMKFLDGDHEMQGASTSSDGKSVVYSLPKPKAASVTATLTYWLDLKKAKLPLENLPASAAKAHD